MSPEPREAGAAPRPQDMDLFLRHWLGPSVKPKPQYCLAFPLHKLCFAEEEQARRLLYLVGALALLPLALWLRFLLRRLGAAGLKANTSEEREPPTETSAAADIRPKSPSVLQTLQVLTGILAKRRDLETKLKTLQNLNNSTHEGVGHRVGQRDYCTHSTPSQ